MKDLRGNVNKYLPLFIGYVKVHGSDVVREVLQKGHSGKYRMRLPLNKKDRYQMLQMLDLVKVNLED